MAQSPETARPFGRNLENKGRWIRGLASLLFFVGVFVLHDHAVFSVVLFLSGAFLLLEALRGWCALRACGVRTRF